METMRALVKKEARPGLWLEQVPVPRIGINDVGLQMADAAFAVNLEEIVVQLRKLGAPMAIANIPDLALAPAIGGLVPRSIYERRIELFNEHVTATAARHGLTLVDLSADMLEMSRRLNPGCAHHQGDMRTLRLGRTFDAVFVHDAVAYMTTEADLRQVTETAFAHCRPGGIALFVPDHTTENFEPVTDQ